MRVPFYDIRAQYEDCKAALDADVHEILSSGAYAPGKRVVALEQAIAASHGVKHGVAVNSGTDALRIMMDAAGIGSGDEVITTAFTFVASTETIVQTGATPVFVDIDEVTCQINPDLIEAAITPRTRAILPIHLFGQMCEMEKIMSIAEKHGLIVLEDAAQALGCNRNGRWAGQWGQSAGLSFYVTKNLGAAGDGGMILTDSDEIAEKCRSMRVHGMGRERYYYDYLGYTSRLDELQGGILGIKFPKLPDWNANRARIAEVYLAGMEDACVHLPSILPGNNTTWHQFTLRSERRDELQAHLKEREIDSMIYYPVPLHFHSPYRHLAEKGSLPITERVSNQVLSLPIHPHLNVDQAKWVCESVRDFASVSA